MAEVAPNERTRKSLFRHAEPFEIDARLIIGARLCMSESQELLSRTTALIQRSSDAQMNCGYPLQERRTNPTLDEFQEGK
jgi:hypothetical protein